MNAEVTQGDKIEKAFHRIQEKQCVDETELYELLHPYIQGVVRRYYINPYKMDNSEVIDDITQDVLVDIFRLDLKNFEEKSGKFVTYCGVIAKNKTIDAMRWQARHQDEIEEEIDKALYEASVEDVVLAEYEKLELIDRTKHYLRLFVELPEKPYRLVSGCFSVLLFHKYFPRTRELSSPGWAFEQLSENSVEMGADRFMEEMNQWMPYISLYWSDEFLDGLYEVECGKRVGQLIFGENFKKKDFENWAVAIRKKIKNKMSEAEYNRCVMELS